MNDDQPDNEQFPVLLQRLTDLLSFSWALPDDRAFRLRIQKLQQIRALAREAEILSFQKAKTDRDFAVAVKACWKELVEYPSLKASADGDGVGLEEMLPLELSQDRKDELTVIIQAVTQGDPDLSDPVDLGLYTRALRVAFDIERAERAELYQSSTGVYKGLAKFGAALGGLFTVIGGAVILLAGAVFLYQLMQPKKIWRAEYFTGKSFDKSFQVSGADMIDFHWDHEGPVAGMRGDNFSARYYSCLVLESDSEVKFELGSDDGARAFLDERKIIDRWGPNPYSVSLSTENVKAGSHLLQIDYFEIGGGAVLTLKVSVDGVPISDSPVAGLRAVDESKGRIGCEQS